MSKEIDQNENEEKWILNHAIHRGTMMSRDNAFPEKFDTQKEAIKAFQEYRKSYLKIGYQIWYANLTSPTGEETTLEQNPYY